MSWGERTRARSCHRERSDSRVILLERAATVTKLDIANRELCAAICMFFADGDAVTVHALACAASEKHGGKTDATLASGGAAQSDPDCSENERWEILNGSRDFFRHPEKDLTDRIMFSDEMNDFVLFAASNNCSNLSGRNPPIEVQVYMAWFHAV